MILNILKVKKNHSNYDLIVLRKNYSVIRIIGIFYRESGLIQFSKAKLVVLDVVEISYWVYVHRLKLPKWLFFFFVKLKHISYTYNASIRYSRFMEPYSSCNDLYNFKNRNRFYKSKCILRQWIRYQYKKHSKVNSNVHLYKKKL